MTQFTIQFHSYEGKKVCELMSVLDDLKRNYVVSYGTKIVCNTELEESEYQYLQGRGYFQSRLGRCERCDGDHVEIDCPYIYCD